MQVATPALLLASPSSEALVQGVGSVPARALAQPRAPALGRLLYGLGKVASSSSCCHGDGSARCKHSA